MTNAELFKKVFGIYAEEFWSYTETEMLNWINADVPDTNVGDINDTISRQAAIKAIGGIAWLIPEARLVACDKIRALPSAEPRWIPCSERLPEENMWTICQNNAGAMMIGKYNIEFGWMFPAYFDGIVAWQPQPEPWRGEADAETD